MNFLTTIVAFVVTLGLLIIIHELGHYCVARLCNVKVLRFSVGFGRPLWSRRRGPDQTEWSISAFPFGGYVKMLDEREGPVDSSEAHRAFNRQSVARRFGIVLAGPVANFLLAIFLYWILFMHGVPGMKAVLGPVAANTPAAVAGFANGDTIAKIGNETVDTWQDARWVLLQRAVKKDRVPVTVRTRSGEIVQRELDLSHVSAGDLDSDFLRVLGLARYQPPIAPVIGNVVAGGVAERAGLQPGDQIVAINDRPVKTWEEVVSAVRAHPGEPLMFEVKRAEKTATTVPVTPEVFTESGKAIGRIGAGPKVDRDAFAELMTEVRYGPVESIAKALYKTWDTSAFSLQMLGKMIVGEVSLKNLSGPITIADYAGQSAQMGWVSFLLFLALISISLGVLNLLPIPLLDGGHLMYYVFEVFKGSPVSDKAIEIGQHLGMALLFVLMAFALYNDINRLISG
ncbi:MAG: rseP [Betaproteobacteria bacterium]|jgi:regulator of sigma E protease|nr:rseP [Betaproteobacteria bacterium]MEA3152770.1 regulator of sigma protease [Betaproteobacteria bacterium]